MFYSLYFYVSDFGTCRVFFFSSLQAEAAVSENTALRREGASQSGASLNRAVFTRIKHSQCVERAAAFYAARDLTASSELFFYELQLILHLQRKHGRAGFMERLGKAMREPEKADFHRVWDSFSCC